MPSQLQFQSEKRVSVFHYSPEIKDQTSKNCQTSKTIHPARPKEALADEIHGEKK
jgi:hypothetical protein